MSDQRAHEDEPREREERADEPPEPDNDVQPPVHHDDTPADEPGESEEPY